MNKLTLFFPVMLLAGCVSSTVSTTPAMGDLVARDITSKLASHYPPARTRFCLGLPVKSTFDRSLTDSLRKKGYSVATTCTSKDQSRIYWQAFMNTSKTMMSVSLHINHEVMSRAWKITGSTATPLSVWTRGV